MAQDVPVLNNQLLNIEPLDVLGVMDAIEAHYQKLDDFGKWCISKSIKCLEIQDKQTLRMFKDLLVRVAIALKRQGVVVSDTDLKVISLLCIYGLRSGRLSRNGKRVAKQLGIKLCRLLRSLRVLTTESSHR